MTTNSPSTAIGVFDSREQMDAAVAELRIAGFDGSQIRIGAGPTDAREAGGPPTWESGGAVGGLSGVVVRDRLGPSRISEAVSPLTRVEQVVNVCVIVLFADGRFAVSPSARAGAGIYLVS
jgi:hypothetical protein